MCLSGVVAPRRGGATSITYSLGCISRLKKETGNFSLIAERGGHEDVPLMSPARRADIKEDRKNTDIGGGSS